MCKLCRFCEETTKFGFWTGGMAWCFQFGGLVSTNSWSRLIWEYWLRSWILCGAGLGAESDGARSPIYNRCKLCRFCEETTKFGFWTGGMALCFQFGVLNWTGLVSQMCLKCWLRARPGAAPDLAPRPTWRRADLAPRHFAIFLLNYITYIFWLLYIWELLFWD